MRQIYYASQRVHTANPFPMDVGGTTAWAIGEIAGSAAFANGALLDKAGWGVNVLGSVAATATVTFPFGLPGWETAPTFECEIAGTWFESVGIGWAGISTPGLVFVALKYNPDGTINQYASFAELKFEIEWWTLWTVVIVPPTGSSSTWTLDLTAPGKGPYYNDNSNWDFNGQNCVLAGPSGGAWQWISASGLYGAQLAVTLVAQPVPGYAYSNLQIDVLYPGGTTYTWTLGCRARYQFWANEYSLAFWCDPVDDVVEALSGGVAAYHSFFYAGIPRQCDLVYEFPPTAGSAFSHWDPARTLVANYNPGVDVLNGSYGAFTGLNFALAVPVASYEIDAKCAVDPVSSSPPGPAMAIPARLGLPGAISAPPNSVFVVGWLYDGMVVTAEYPLGSQVPYDGYTWIAMLAQPGATLFLCYAPLPGLGSAFTCNARAGARF